MPPREHNSMRAKITFSVLLIIVSSGFKSMIHACTDILFSCALLYCASQTYFFYKLKVSPSTSKKTIITHFIAVV